MKRTMIATAIALGLGAIASLVLLLLLGSGSHLTEAQGPDGYDTYYVAPDGDCGGVTPCYASVQAAVDAADDPADVVKVATGSYSDVHARAVPLGYDGGIHDLSMITQVVHITKTVTILGGYTNTNWTVADPDANPTKLDALGQGRVLVICGDASPTIEGLRITGGNAVELVGDGMGWDAGGGVYVINATPAIRGNWVFSNTASKGGGVYVIRAVPLIDQNRVFSNTANEGGGLYLVESRGTVLSGNTIASNSSERGGGLMASDCHAALSGNSIIFNTSTTLGGGLCLEHSHLSLNGNAIAANNAAMKGGGAFLFGGYAEVVRNTIVANTAADGGGLYLLDTTDATLDGNTIISNATSSSGGGLFLALSFGDMVLTSNVIADNRAGTLGSGLYIKESPTHLLHNTIARNSGGDGSGVYVTYGTTVMLTNTILVSHTMGIVLAADCKAILEGTLWGSGAWANGVDWSGNVATGVVNLWDDPVFVDPNIGDYHIEVTSAARDAGVNAGITADMDGQTRLHYAAPDLGADECWPLVAVKTATPDTAERGEVVTYTLALQNITDVPMTVHLTDALPGQVGYFGPLVYSNGSGGYASDVITWTGTVFTNATTLVTWSVQVGSDVPYSSTIENTAIVSDLFGVFQTDPHLIFVPQHDVYLPVVLRQHP